MYVNIRLIGKCIDLLIVLIELVCWCATSNYRLKIGVFAPTRSVSPKILGRRSRSPPTNRSSSHRTRLSGLSYGVKIWIELFSVLSQSTRLTNGRTDRQLSLARPSPRLHSMQRCKKRNLLYVKEWCGCLKR